MTALCFWKHALLLTALAICAAFSSVDVKATPTDECFDSNELRFIAASFSQINNLINSPKGHCRSQMDPQWFQLARVLITVSKMSQVVYPTIDLQDDLTLRAIDETDWWAYLTKRLNRIKITSEYCHFGEAYVFNNIPGVMNICKKYFSLSFVQQIATLLHEARHFDGFKHIWCDHVLSPNCDESLEQKGSWAITIQALVTLGFAKNIISEADRQLSQRLVLESIYSRFKKIPRVLMTKGLIVSTDNSRFTQWLQDPKTEVWAKESEFELDEPGHIESIGHLHEIAVFPFDFQKPGRRYSLDPLTLKGNFGQFLNEYNSRTAQQRRKLVGATYGISEGALLFQNEIVSSCKTSELHSFAIDRSDAQLFSLPEDRGNRVYLMKSDGHLEKVVCSDPHNFQLIPENLKMPPNLKKIFSLGQTIYGLFADGRVRELIRDENDQTYRSRDISATGPFGLTGITQIMPTELPFLFMQKK